MVKSRAKQSFNNNVAPIPHDHTTAALKGNISDMDLSNPLDERDFSEFDVSDGEQLLDALSDDETMDFIIENGAGDEDGYDGGGSVSCDASQSGESHDGASQSSNHGGDSNDGASYGGARSNGGSSDGNSGHPNGSGNDGGYGAHQQQYQNPHQQGFNAQPGQFNQPQAHFNQHQGQFNMPQSQYTQQPPLRQRCNSEPLINSEFDQNFFDKYLPNAINAVNSENQNKFLGNNPTNSSNHAIPPNLSRRASVDSKPPGAKVKPRRKARTKKGTSDMMSPRGGGGRPLFANSRDDSSNKYYDDTYSDDGISDVASACSAPADLMELAGFYNNEPYDPTVNPDRSFDGESHGTHNYPEEEGIGASSTMASGRTNTGSRGNHGAPSNTSNGPGHRRRKSAPLVTDFWGGPEGGGGGDPNHPPNNANDNHNSSRKPLKRRKSDPLIRSVSDFWGDDNNNNANNSNRTQHFNPNHNMSQPMNQQMNPNNFPLQNPNSNMPALSAENELSNIIQVAQEAQERINQLRSLLGGNVNLGGLLGGLGGGNMNLGGPMQAGPQGHQGGPPGLPPGGLPPGGPPPGGPPPGGPPPPGGHRSGHGMGGVPGGQARQHGRDPSRGSRSSQYGPPPGNHKPSSYGSKPGSSNNSRKYAGSSRTKHTVGSGGERSGSRNQGKSPFPNQPNRGGQMQNVNHNAVKGNKPNSQSGRSPQNDNFRGNKAEKVPLQTKGHPKPGKIGSSIGPGKSPRSLQPQHLKNEEPSNNPMECNNRSSPQAPTSSNISTSNPSMSPKTITPKVETSEDGNKKRTPKKPPTSKSSSKSATKPIAKNPPGKPTNAPYTPPSSLPPNIPFPDPNPVYDPKIANLDHDAVMTKLKEAMDRTTNTQKQLQEWDRANGLPKSHSQTMVNSSRSRKQLADGVILKKWNGAPLIELEMGAKVVQEGKVKGDVEMKKCDEKGKSRASEKG